VVCVYPRAVHFPTPASRSSSRSCARPQGASLPARRGSVSCAASWCRPARRRAGWSRSRSGCRRGAGGGRVAVLDRARVGLQPCPPRQLLTLGSELLGPLACRSVELLDARKRHGCRTERRRRGAVEHRRPHADHDRRAWAQQAARALDGGARVRRAVVGDQDGPTVGVARRGQRDLPAGRCWPTCVGAKGDVSIIPPNLRVSPKIVREHGREA
jgi:hypothetical protein